MGAVAGTKDPRPQADRGLVLGESLVEALGFADARTMLPREHEVDAAFFEPIGERYEGERSDLEALFASELHPRLVGNAYSLVHMHINRILPASQRVRRRHVGWRARAPK